MSVPPDPPPDERLAGASLRPDAIMRIRWNDGQVTRLTSAFPPVAVPVDAVETEVGKYYASFPSLTQLPALRAMINGSADVAEFNVDGLPSEIQRLADEETGLVKGAAIHVGKIYWDSDWRLIGGARWCWLGAGGKVRFRVSGARVSADGVASQTSALSLSATAGEIRGAGAERGYWTDAQHQAEHPGDKFFQYVAFYYAGRRLAWPLF